VSSNLKSSLEESSSQPITNISSISIKHETFPATVCTCLAVFFHRAQSQCPGTESSRSFNDIDNALKRDCKRYKSQIVREAQRSLIYNNNCYESQIKTRPQQQDSPHWHAPHVQGMCYFLGQVWHRCHQYLIQVRHAFPSLQFFHERQQ